MTTNTKHIENETLKHLVFACVASNDAKRNQNGKKTKSFSREVINEYKKPAKLSSKYNRKVDELSEAIKFIDRIKNPNIASYNIKKGKDANGISCYELIFNVKFREDDVLFGFHLPKCVKNFNFGNNNYPKITKKLLNNDKALEIVLDTNEIFETGLSQLELFA